MKRAREVLAAAAGGGLVAIGAEGDGDHCDAHGGAVTARAGSMPVPGQLHELEREAIGDVLHLVAGGGQVQLVVATTSTRTRGAAEDSRADPHALPAGARRPGSIGAGRRRRWTRRGAARQ